MCIRDSPTDRSIIESYYKISLALEFDPNESEKCKVNLIKCIDLLKARIDTKDKDDKDQKELLVELQTKLKELDDAESQMNSLKQTLLSTIHAVTAPLTSGEEINDLTSSVVKKRKSVEKSLNHEIPDSSKKQKK